MSAANTQVIASQLYGLIGSTVAAKLRSAGEKEGTYNK